MNRDDAPNDRYVWCVFAFYSVPSNDQDYDVLKGIFDSEEKAISYQKEQEKMNKSSHKYFGVERMRIE